MKVSRAIGIIVLATVVVLPLTVTEVFAASSSLDILRQGLLGAGTGALSAGMSGGKAGKGALIGAGTNVIGGALLGFLTDSPSGGYGYQPAQQPVYTQSYYSAPQVQPVYQPEPVYVQPTPVYSQSQPDANKQIIKQGILGAGTGAIAASASGGNAGKGALIGAGTNIIGGALLDTLTGPSASPAFSAYYSPQASAFSASTINGSALQPQKHILRKYSADGKVVSEEEFWQ